MRQPLGGVTIFDHKSNEWHVMDWTLFLWKKCILNRDAHLNGCVLNWETTVFWSIFHNKSHAHEPWSLIWSHTELNKIHLSPLNNIFNDDRCIDNQHYWIGCFVLNKYQFCIYLSPICPIWYAIGRWSFCAPAVSWMWIESLQKVD